MNTELLSQQCVPEDTSKGLPPTISAQMPVHADLTDAGEAIGASVILESNVHLNRHLEDCNENESDQLVQESVVTYPVPSGHDREQSPAKKNPHLKAKLVIPASLLYSGIDGSLYDLDSLPVPYVTKGPAPSDAPAAQAQPALPETSDQTDIGDSTPKTPFSKAVGSMENPSDSPAIEGEVPQHGAYTPPPGQTGGWTADGVFIPMYSRKEKSLGLLCDK